MNIFAYFNSQDQSSTTKKVFKLLTTVVVILGIFLALNFLFPVAVGIVLNIIWIVFLAVVIVFFTLGILVIIGMRKEVSRILDILLEGSLTIIDFIEFIKNLWRRFVQLLKEFVLFAAPFLAYILTLIVYVFLMIIYKNVGKNGDVTTLTVILTSVLLIITGILNKPTDGLEEVNNWKKEFLNRFKAGFIDGFEVVLFIFFLTMDSTNLFFLPDSLNVPIKAQIFGHDLMVRSIAYKDNFRFTLNLIECAIIIEIIRNIIRIVVAAMKFYEVEMHAMVQGEKMPRITAIKNAIRLSFSIAKNDLMKFIAYTTVLFSVFILFPKLKLFTLVVASATNFTLDLIFRQRLTHKSGKDLISRILGFLIRF